MFPPDISHRWCDADLTVTTAKPVQVIVVQRPVCVKKGFDSQRK